MRDTEDRKPVEHPENGNGDLYKEMVDNSIDAVMLIQNRQILFVNKAFCKLFGYTKREIIESDFSLLPDIQDRERMMTLYERRINGERDTLYYTFRFIHKSGTSILIELNASTIEVNGKNAFVASIRDITENVRMQQALQRCESKYHELAEMLPLAVYELSVDGIPTYMNRTGLNLLGLLGQPDYRAKPATAYFKLADQALMAATLADESRRVARRNGKLEPIAAAPMEYTVCRPDGTEVPVIIYGTAIIENNRIVGSRGIMVDISERKAMENALRESEQRYRELADFMPQTLYELDEQLHLVYINKSGKEMYGLTDADYGRLNLRYFAEADRPRVAQNLQALMAGQRHEFMCEYTTVDTQGRYIPVITYSMPIYKEGKIVGVRGLGIDISEQKANEQALRESERKYRELAEMLPQTVYELDKQGNIRYLNKTGKDKLGSDYETRPVSIFSYIHPDQGAVIRRNIGGISNNTVPEKSYFYTFRQKDGQTFEAMISAAPLVVNGETIGSRGVMIDISEHKAMQEALAESEEKYRSLIENATDAIVIVQDGLLKFANQAMCDMVMYTRDELINTPLANYIDKEDPELRFKFHGRNVDGVRFSNIFRNYFVRKDAKRITVELNARTLNYEGQPAEFIVIRDITKRLKIETELQIAKSELETLNSHLEKRVKDSSKRLAEARTQLINLQKENLQSQYDVLKQQVNPHFLFNSLNVLTSLIKIDPDLAEQFSEQLSKVYRYVLENRDNELIDLNTELSFLNAYIFLINIRFMDKLEVRMEIPEERRSDKIIPLAMQLLIENAIKHNVMSKSRPLVIDIFVDNHNYLNVVNNLQERPSQVVSTGLGLKNIINRYQLLNLKSPVFEKTENQFIARIPLVKNFK